MHCIDKSCIKVWIKAKQKMEFNPNRKPGADFEKLMTKVNVPCDLRSPNEPPEWLDKKLFDAGTQFFRDYSFVTVLSSIFNFLVGISIPNLW